MIGFIAGVVVANHLVRRVERAIDPPRSWVAIEMERRVVPHGLEVSDGIALVYTLVMAPVFTVVAIVLGMLGLVTAGTFGALLALLIAGVVGHTVAMRVCAKVVDASVRELLR